MYNFLGKISWLKSSFHSFWQDFLIRFMFDRGPVKWCGQWALCLRVLSQWVQKQCEGQGSLPSGRAGSQEEGQATPNVLLICGDCRAWKVCFLAIWGQENPVLCHTHTHTFGYLLCGLLSCCGGIKTDSPLITSWMHHQGTSILLATESVMLNGQ